MNIRIQKLMTVAMVVLLVSFSGCSSGGGSDSTPASTPTDDSSGGYTITGQVVVTSSDLGAARLRTDQIALAKAAAIHFATFADSALPDAVVTLYKINADGTEAAVSGVTATTDSSGNYTLTNVPEVVSGTGAATDFYYEVRATSGSIEVSAPAAPTADDTVNLSPETKIAAAMISDVASVPSITSPSVLPTEQAIDLLRDFVYANIGKMTTFTLPSMATGDESKVVIAAEAISSNSGNAEKLMRAFDALKEALYLQENRSTVSETRIASYLDRVTRASCNFQGPKLPQAAGAALAAAFKAGTTYTLDQLTAAYNDNGGNPTVDVNGVVTAFNAILSNLNTALTNSADIPDSAMLGVYESRGDLSPLTASSSLEADQALLLLQAMAPSNQQCQASLNYQGIIAELTGDTTLSTTAAFSDIEVYHQRAQCPEGSLEARVKVFAPQPTTVTDVTIFAAGLKDQLNNAISSAVTLTTDDMPSPGTSNWKLSGGATQVCLAFGQTYTFSITANLSSSSTLTTEVTRTVANVPEASVTLMAKDYSESNTVFTQGSTGQSNNPIKLSTALSSERPLFKWSPAPGADAAADIGAPAGAQIKYLYDVSHFDITHGGPENRDAANCPVVQNSNGKFFDKNYIISPIDCDVDKCDTAVSDVPHVCRIHVQTVLVDENDRTLGWSAGADLYYCIEGQSNCP